MTRLAALLPVLAVSSSAYAGELTIKKSQNVAITSLTTVSFQSGVWSGWIEVGDKNAICFDIFHDYTAATGVTMRCETSQVSTTTADAGFDLQSLSIDSGTATSSLLTFSNLTGADERWNWCVDDLPGAFINCLFDDVASGAAGDKILVVRRVLTP